MAITLPIVALPDVPPAAASGKVGRLQVVPISSLVIDTTYQRNVSIGSVRNIRRICSQFDWAKFLPVIVTEDGDKFAIVDGQHRTIAAASIGITDVPCYVLSCSAAEAAAAFAAINGNVTPMQPIDLWFAELAAASPKAVSLKRVLDAAGVTVSRKKEGHLAGETRSINVLQRALEFYGSAVLTTILQCIVETGDGNPGMITGAVVNGIGRAIRTKPDLLSNPTRLFEVFDGISLSNLVYEAGIENARSGNPIQFIITRQVNAEIRAASESRSLPNAA
jgi:ParB-like nuclease domain